MVSKINTVIALLFILSVGIITSCANNENVIHIATKPMTEQYILGEMVKSLIEENSELKVKVTEGIGGGTLNIHPALLTKDFDLYPEYTGTGWNTVLKEDSVYKDDKFSQLQSSYNDLDLMWKGMVGFNNTYGIGVTKEVAEQYNLKTYSDLSEVSDQLVFGGEYDFFEREDGYKMLQNVYNLNFKKTMDLDIGLKYNAIEQGKIDVVNIFTTDGRLEQAGLVVLEDDKNMYPSYKCGFVVRKEVLEKNPILVEVFRTLENVISNEDMMKMNYYVEIMGEDYKDVAYNFLRQKRLIK